MKVSNGGTDSSFIIHAPLSAAQAAVEASANRVGKVKNSSPGSVKAGIKYGLNTVNCDINLHESGGVTTMTVNARNGSVYSGPNKSAIERLVNGVINSENASYQADRTGVQASTLVFSVLGFVVVLVVIMGLLTAFVL